MQKSLVVNSTGLSFLVLGVLLGMATQQAQDGRGPYPRLQHPLGVVLHQDRWYGAGRSHHQIKPMDPDLQTSRTSLGSGRPDDQGALITALHEPGGLNIAAGKRSIADTDNNVTRVTELAPGELGGLRPSGFTVPKKVGVFEALAWVEGEAIVMPTQSLAAGVTGELIIHFALPSGYKVNAAAPVTYAIDVRGNGLQVPDSGRPSSAHTIELPLKIPLQTLPGTHRAELDVEATFYWCREDETGVCMIQFVRWHVPVDISHNVGHRQLLVSATAQLLDVAGSPLAPMAPPEYKR